MKRPAPCRCPDCARLDLAFPGEGVQLAFPIGRPSRARRAPPANLQRHIAVCQHSDVSPAEGVAIMTVAAVDVMTFMAGAATILSDPHDVEAAFDGALKAITTGAQVARDPIVTSLNVALTQMRAAQS